MQIMKKICGQLSDIPRVIRAFIRRDDIILVDENRAAKEQAVNIHWWKISSEEQNVGDMLSPVVVEYMMHRLDLPDTAPKKRHLIAIGSLIDTSYQDATIWGSGVLVDGYGIVLNNQMDDFVYDAESVNVVEPGKTPLSSMTPTVVFKDGKPAMMLSAPGGYTIFSMLSQLFINVVDYGMNAEEAIAAARYLCAFGTLQYDAPEVDEAVFEELAAMGHEISATPGKRFSLPSLICFDADGNITGCTEYTDEGLPLDGCALGY